MSDLGTTVDPADGLPAMVVGGARADRKLYFLEYYASMMSKMGAFNRRAYVELCAGPGRVQYQENGVFEDGSPLRALKQAFTEFHYIELREDYAGALEQRCRSREQLRPVQVVQGDCNERIKEVVPHLPPAGLTLAFIDPTNWQVNFETVRLLTGVQRIDLVVSMFLGSMKRVPRENRPDVDAFFGTDRWRTPPYTRPDGSLTLEGMMRCYREQLVGLGYLDHTAGREISVKTKTGAPLYLLAFFSRHKLGYQFWEQAIKREPGGQMTLPL